MKKYTYNDLLEHLLNNHSNLGENALGAMMDIVEAETGRFPDWDDVAPDWVVKNCIK